MKKLTESLSRFPAIPGGRGLGLIAVSIVRLLVQWTPAVFGVGAHEKVGGRVNVLVAQTCYLAVVDKLNGVFHVLGLHDKILVVVVVLSDSESCHAILFSRPSGRGLYGTKQLPPVRDVGLVQPLEFFRVFVAG